LSNVPSAQRAHSRWCGSDPLGAPSTSWAPSLADTGCAVPERPSTAMARRRKPRWAPGGDGCRACRRGRASPRAGVCGHNRIIGDVWGCAVDRTGQSGHPGDGPHRVSSSHHPRSAPWSPWTLALSRDGQSAQPAPSASASPPREPRQGLTVGRVGGERNLNHGALADGTGDVIDHPAPRPCQATRSDQISAAVFAPPTPSSETAATVRDRHTLADRVSTSPGLRPDRTSRWRSTRQGPNHPRRRGLLALRLGFAANWVSSYSAHQLRNTTLHEQTRRV
jgi:hypothetical protein